MMPALPNPNSEIPLNDPEQMLRTIAVLAFHLAVELDYHYEDEDSSKLTDELAALRVAAETLHREGVTPPEAVVHSLSRFTE